MSDAATPRDSVAPRDSARERLRRFRISLLSGRGSAGTALIILALIVFPSALLGYLSWRAIESERSYSLERLSESYRHFVRLAAREMDLHLREAEERWAAEIDTVLAAGAPPTAAQLAARIGKEPLVSGFFLIHAPTRTVYPPILLGTEEDSPNAWEQETRVRDNARFTQIVARGEDLEYHAQNLPAAIETYRTILDEVTNQRLHAMAVSFIGRAQLKNRQPSAALATYQMLLQRYPDARDLNGLYLRFLAQYQIAVALEGLGRSNDALATLVALNQDLLKRSDAINTAQYAYYAELIQTLTPRLLSGPGVMDRERFENTFAELKEQSKKRVSDKYFLQILDAEMDEIVVRRKRYSPEIHYISAAAEGEPFLLAYRALPDAQSIHTIGLLAVQIDLDQVQIELTSTIRNLPTGAEARVSILATELGDAALADGPGGKPIAAVADANRRDPIAAQTLGAPFGFWQVAVYLQDVPRAMRRLDLRTTLWLWLVSLLVLIILVGAYMFILRAHREARLSRAQTTFVSKVTHELRTPLSSIKMFAELLEMRIADMPRRSDAVLLKNAEQYLGIIRHECDRLGRLIDRVIDFSRLEQRVHPYHFDYHDVTDVVTRVVESFRPYAEARGFDLKMTAEQAMPRVRLDADALAQVLLNFLDNAVQFSDQVKELRVHLRKEPGAVAIDVSDRGVGIEPKSMNHLFDKFYTSHGRMGAKRSGGLGLGLSLSREIVREHGGEIRVRSEVGAGSTFTVVIPVTIVDFIRVRPDAVASSIEAGVSAGRSK